jgi:GTP-dependent phosphoenolpyruvate carboxykinase
MEDYVILRVSPEVRKILEREKTQISLVQSDDGEQLLIGKECFPLHMENVLSRNEVWKSFNGSTFIKNGDVLRVLDTELAHKDVRDSVPLNSSHTLKTQVFDNAAAEIDVLLLSGNSAESVRDIKFEEEIVG